jgi:hypothetical protein
VLLLTVIVAWLVEIARGHIVAWLVEIARGHSGQPYDWLAAIGGLAYVAGIALFRWRG